MKTPKPGDVFDRLTVLGVFDVTPKHGAKMLCQCDCGEKSVVYAQSLFRGFSRSCGCLRDEVATRHGGYKTPEYQAWNSMKKRCFNKDDRHYKDYGGRDITVDERWLGKDGYEIFLEDMGRRPGPGFSLDRKNNGHGYSKENCRWATSMEQQNNKRNNTLLTLDGKTQTVGAWCRELGIHPATMRSRLRSGYSQEQALRTPVRRKR